MENMFSGHSEREKSCKENLRIATAKEDLENHLAQIGYSVTTLSRDSTKNQQRELYEVKNLLHSKAKLKPKPLQTTNRAKVSPTEWKKIFAVMLQTWG